MSREFSIIFRIIPPTGSLCWDILDNRAKWRELPLLIKLKTVSENLLNETNVSLQGKRIFEIKVIQHSQCTPKNPSEQKIVHPFWTRLRTRWEIMQAVTGINWTRWCVVGPCGWISLMGGEISRGQRGECGNNSRANHLNSHWAKPTSSTFHFLCYHLPLEHMSLTMLNYPMFLKFEKKAFFAYWFFLWWGVVVYWIQLEFPRFYWKVKWVIWQNKKACFIKCTLYLT